MLFSMSIYERDSEAMLPKPTSFVSEVPLSLITKVIIMVKCDCQFDWL